MTVVFSPPATHTCRPGWSEHFSDGPAGWQWYLKEERVPFGSVVQCACGKTWVCEQHPASNIFRRVWRRERRGERRRRERAA